MRIVKEAAIRRNEILDAAERLFVAKGFDQTSTNDILAEVGIARGTLYYHFKSKEEILNAMIQRITENLVAKAAEIAGQKDFPVLGRMTEMMMALNVDSDLGHEIMEQVHKPQNALMHQKMQEGLLAGITPLITGLIEEGISQGICQTDYPKETAEMLLLYSNTAFDDLAEGSHDQQRILAFIYNTERLLGMPQGSMQEVILPIFSGAPKHVRSTESKPKYEENLSVRELSYITLREKPELKEDAAQWFHSKWGVPKEAYLACMEAYLKNETEYGWYLCLDEDKIVGGMGVIENDFHDRKDLSPNVCAVYTEEEYRCKGIAGRLLNMVVNDLRAKGITPVYLVTDHTGFYERYGWEFLCMVQGDGGPEMTRMYIHR